MMKLYYGPGACSFAAHIALEEAGLAYETQKVDLLAGQQRAPEYLALNPRGRVPTLVMDGKVLTENLAILVFVAGGWPKAGLWPSQTWDQARLLSLLTWCSNTVHPAYAHGVRPVRYVDDPSAQELVRARGRVTFFECLKEIDAMLAGRTWAMGAQYTVADPYFLVFYRWANRNKFPVTDLKNYAAHTRHMLARRAVKKVMADEGITLD